MTNNTYTRKSRQSRNYIQSLGSLDAEEFAEMIVRDRNMISVLDIQVARILSIQYKRKEEKFFHAVVEYYGETLKTLEDNVDIMDVIRGYGKFFKASDEEEGTVYITVTGKFLYSTFPIDDKDFVTENGVAECYVVEEGQISDEICLEIVRRLNEDNNIVVMVNGQLYTIWGSIAGLCLQVLGRPYTREYWHEKEIGKTKFWLYLLHKFPDTVKNLKSSIRLSLAHYKHIREHI